MKPAKPFQQFPRYNYHAAFYALYLRLTTDLATDEIRALVAARYPEAFQG